LLAQTWHAIHEKSLNQNTEHVQPEKQQRHQTLWRVQGEHNDMCLILATGIQIVCNVQHKQTNKQTNKQIPDTLVTGVQMKAKKENGLHHQHNLHYSTKIDHGRKLRTMPSSG